jgi:hypothetical protein
MDPSMLKLNDLLEYFELHVEEFVSLNLFKSGRNKKFNNQVHESFCHAETRYSQIVREPIENAKTKKLFDDLKANLMRTRKQHFSDREPIIVKETFLVGETKELENLEKRLEKLKNKKSGCVRYEIDYNQIIFDESDDDSDEECHEKSEKVDEQHENHHQKVEDISQPMRSSSSDVIFGSYPPGHSNSGQNFVPRIPVPLFPSQPVPWSSANVYVGGDFKPGGRRGNQVNKSNSER